MRPYLLQNLKRRSYVNRWTPKKNLLWLLNNTPALYLMSAHFTERNYTLLTPLMTNHHFQLAFRIAFSRSFAARTREGLVFRNYPVTPAIAMTLKYWALRNALSFVNDVDFVNIRLARHHHLAFNRYHCVRPLFLARPTRKVLRAVVFKLLTFIPLGWIRWASKHRFRRQHLYLLTDFHLWRSLNLYYMRIYNL